MAQDFTCSVDCENLNVASSDALCLAKMKLQDPNRSQKAGGRRGQDADPRGLSDSFFPEAALHCRKRFVLLFPLFRSGQFAGNSPCTGLLSRACFSLQCHYPIFQLRRRSILCPIASFIHSFLTSFPWDSSICHCPSAFIFLGFLAFSSSSCPGLGRQRTWGVLFLHVRPKENRGTPWAPSASLTAIHGPEFHRGSVPGQHSQGFGEPEGGR